MKKEYCKSRKNIVGLFPHCYIESFYMIIIVKVYGCKVRFVTGFVVSNLPNILYEEMMIWN